MCVGGPNCYVVVLCVRIRHKTCMYVKIRPHRRRHRGVCCEFSSNLNLCNARRDGVPAVAASDLDTVSLHCVWVGVGLLLLLRGPLLYICV